MPTLEKERISTIRVDDPSTDFNALRNLLSEDLLNVSPSFSSIHPSATSQYILDLLSGYGAMLSYRTVSAVNNNFLEDAVDPQVIYRLADFLGNYQTGSKAAACTVRLVKSSQSTGQSFFIPQFSEFQINGQPFYNPNPINWASFLNTINVQLKQGRIQTTDFVAQGKDFERFYFSSGFQTDITSDVSIFSNGAVIPFVVEFVSYRLDEMRNSVFLRTSGDGRSYIMFGNGSLGLSSSSGSLVTARYFENIGESGNILQVGVPVQLSSGVPGLILDPTSVTITSALGGTNVPSPDVVKWSSPKLFAAADRCVTRNDYRARILELNNSLIAAQAWGEYEMAQLLGYSDNTLMNRAYISAIKNVLRYPNQPMPTLPSPGFVEVPTTDDYVPGTFSNTVNWMYDDIPRSQTYVDDRGYGWLTSPSYPNEVRGFVNFTLSDNPNNNTNPTYPVSNIQPQQQDPGNPVNYDASWIYAIDNSQYWQTTRQPDISNSVILQLQMPDETAILGSIVLRANNQITASGRAFPKTMKVFGWPSDYALKQGVTDPTTVLTIGNQINNPYFDNITDLLNIPEPGINGAVEVSLNTLHQFQDPTAVTPKVYSQYFVEFYDSYGSGSISLGGIKAAHLMIDLSDGDISYQNTYGGFTLGTKLYSYTGFYFFYTNGMTQTEKDSLVYLLKPRKNFTPVIKFIDPTISLIDIDLSVKLNEYVNSSDTLNEVERITTSLINPKVGEDSGYGTRYVKMSDLNAELREIDGVDNVRINLPSQDVFLLWNEVALLGNLTISTLE